MYWNLDVAIQNWEMCELAPFPHSFYLKSKNVSQAISWSVAAMLRVGFMRSQEHYR